MERDLKRILKAYEDAARLCINNIRYRCCDVCSDCVIGRTLRALDLVLKED